MIEQIARVVVDNEFCNLKIENRKQYDNIVWLLVKYGVKEPNTGQFEKAYNHAIGTSDEYTINLDVFNRLEKESHVSIEIDGRFENAYKHAMTVLDGLMDTTEELIRRLGENGDHDSAFFFTRKLSGLRAAKRTIEENIKMFLEHPEAIAENCPAKAVRNP